MSGLVILKIQADKYFYHHWINLVEPLESLIRRLSYSDLSVSICIFLLVNLHLLFYVREFGLKVRFRFMRCSVCTVSQNVLEYQDKHIQCILY